MNLIPTDWLVIWKIYHYPFGFWIYAAFSLTARLFMVSRTKAASATQTWLLSSALSLLIFPAIPFLALPAFAWMLLPMGERIAHTHFMAIPIAICVGLVASLLDLVLFRILRQSIDSNTIWLLVGTNILVIALAISVIVARNLIHPVQMIADVF